MQDKFQVLLQHTIIMFFIEIFLSKFQSWNPHTHTHTHKNKLIQTVYFWLCPVYEKKRINKINFQFEWFYFWSYKLYGDLKNF